MKLRAVASSAVKRGMVISLHGTVKSAKPFTGRAVIRKGKTWKHLENGDPMPAAGYELIHPGAKGFLFITDQHPDGLFYGIGERVWIVDKAPMKKKATPKKRKGVKS